MNGNSTCATCRFAQFKVGGDRALIQCLNETVLDCQKISLVITEEVFNDRSRLNKLKGDITDGRIYYRNTFGCIHHEPLPPERPDPLAPQVVN